MKKEKESGKPDLHSTSEITGPSTPSIYRAASGAIIDFHSAEFNRTDDLNDCSGSYRFFERLDGVITADMRHQMDRLREEGCIDSSVDQTATSNETKKEIESDEPEPVEALPPLTVVSQGRTLIIDTDAERAVACGKILSDQLLTCTLVVTKKASTDALFPRLSRPVLLYADGVSITGAFGCFSATVTAKGNQTQLAERFDLVLDLQPTPSFSGDRLPMGYYAPEQNSVDLNDVLTELPEMRGRFEKPQFAIFHKSRCFHGLSRTRNCRQCAEVCPFGAIQTDGREISVNHYLCHGCGCCAVVCPADAIRMAHPSHEELLDSLKRALENGKADDASVGTLVISDSQNAKGHVKNDSVVNFEVEEIGYIGLEMILAALAHGAHRVVVACGRHNPPKIREAVAWQAQMASAILKGLDMLEEKVRFVVIPPEDDDYIDEVSRADGPDMQFSNSPMPPLAASSVHDRRALVRLTVQHLYDKSGAKRPWLVLPSGSPFGAVTVDSNTCTLCMACAAACPSGALTAGGDVPRLQFLESRCHQCGLCEETCPEHAIQLQTRMLCDPEALEARLVMHEADVFRCIKCDSPFAPKVMVNRMQERLNGHWMYATKRQLRRLQMCRVCRTRDALMSEDMKSWNR
ncbi:MAG: 4Fe-4S binding protein [Syntrophales bacterium]